MAGISSLLSIGKSALNASQVALQVTGDNIANVDTEGYSRQTVKLVNRTYVDGVDIDGVTRSYDAFVEAQYLDKISARDRWSVIYSGLTGIESLFNESNTDGLNAAMSTFFSSWGDLTSTTASNASITSMLEDTQTLLSLLRSAASTLASTKNDIKTSIYDDVASLNSLATNIAELNRKIDASAPDTEAYNSLLDSRDALIESVASLADINVVDNGAGNLSIYLASGQTVVAGTTSFTFAYETGQTVRQLSPTSIDNASDVQCYFDGTDASEYTVRVVSNGGVGSGASFEVSLDGGRTWLTDDDGKVLTYAANGQDGKIAVGDLEIWFGATSNAGTLPTSDLEVGDTFTLVPKKALYWYTSAGTPEIISPQQYADGTDNARRLTGGALCGELQLVDSYIGDYEDTLDALTESMVWEINRIYSQGTGSEAYSACVGTYGVTDATVALSNASSGLTFGSRLASGASMMYLYADDGTLVSGASITLDPSTDSLEDVVNKINAAFGGNLTASILNGRISLEAADGYDFRFGDDSSGLFAALGLNTLLTGSTAGDVAINSATTSDLGMVCIGHVGTDGLVASGDTTTASALAELEKTEVSFLINGKTVASQTLSDYYDTLVGTVGADSSSANYQYTYQEALASSLKNDKLAVSAVSLDEELTNLIMYQHAYQAAAKLISTADSMFQTVLAMKS